MKIAVKTIYSDISLLYKNLLHWTISKVIIFIWWVVLGALAIIPFAVLFFIYSLSAWIPFGDFINSLLNSVYMTNLLWNFIYVLSLWAYTLSYFFTFILFIKLSNWYLEWKKIEFIKNEYLNYKLYFRYLKLTLLNLVIFLVPVLVFILILSISIIALGWVEEVSLMVVSNRTNAFSVLSLILFVILLIKLYYLFYRFIFSYFLLLEDSEKATWLVSLLKKSFHLTAWFKKFIVFTISFLLVWLAYLPFSIVSTYINWNYSDLEGYYWYLSLKEEDRATLKWINTYYYEWLEEKYAWKDLSNIESMQTRYYIFSILYRIFEFIFIFGVYTMFLNSFYKRNIFVEEKSSEQKIEL